MALTRGDVNAILKDLTLIAEDTVAVTRPSLVPLIASVKAETGAYTKVPIAANMPFPQKFEGERSEKGKDIMVVQTYNQNTYELTIDLDSDLVKTAQAYDQSDLVREATTSAVLFPDYQMSQAVLSGSAAAAYDGSNFYNSTHTFANVAGAPNISNTVTATGQTPTALFTDLQSAAAKLLTYRDNQGRLLNQQAALGTGKVVVQSCAALLAAWRTLLNGTFIPISVPVTTSGSAAATASNVMQAMADLYVDGYIDSSASGGVTTWYLHYVAMPQRPFVFIENQPIEVQVLGFGSEFQINYRKVRIAISHRFVIGYYRFDRSIKVS